MGLSTEDWTFSGAIRFLLQPTFPDGGVTDAKVAAGAGIKHTKLEHQHRIPFSQVGTAASNAGQVIYRCSGATGTILELAVGSIGIAVGAATVTVDLKKNGTTVLSGVVTLDTGNTAYIAELASISVPGIAAGDALSLVVVATVGGGTLPTGLFVSLTVKEDAA